MTVPAQQRLAVLRDCDPASFDLLLQALPALGGRYDDDREAAALADLLIRTATEAAACAHALIERLASWPADIDLAMLRKWAFFGLRRHRGDADERLRYFTFEDPLAFEAGDADTDVTHARRAELVHYLSGFGFPDLRIELHDPVAAEDARRKLAQRPTIGAELIQLPRRWLAGSARELALMHRAAAAHAAAHLMYSPRARPAGNRQPMLLAVMALIEDARVERLMAQACPGLALLWRRFHTATRAKAGFDFAGLAARLAHALADPGYEDSNTWVNNGRSLFEAALLLDPHDVAAFDHLARLLAIDIEKMRLGFASERYRVEPAYRDDNTLLWNFSAAVEDELRTIVRERYQLKSEPESEPPPNRRRVEVDQRRITHYPEWDCKAETLHDDWTTVIDHWATGAAPGPSAATRPRKPLRFRGLERIPDRSIRLNRLEEGDEIDLNAAIDARVHRHAPQGPDARIFRRHGRRSRSTAVLVLMDLSESTKHFVPGSFTTILDVEKRAARMVAESLDASRDRIAVHGFASNGRGQVDYRHVKDFGEPFGEAQLTRLRRLEGGLSTRMGAALRHAAAQLAAEEADKKLILLLTDGEPSDIDVLEDDYLREDTRHAVTAAARQGIRTFCLTLDRRADPYVRRIFGARNYLVNDHTDAYTRHTGQALVKLIAH